MFPFSENALAILHQAGWSEDYRYDTSGYINLLQSAGYHVHAVARDYMQRFGGLVIHYPHLNPEINDVETAKFSVYFLPGNVGSERARGISEELG